MLLLISNTQKSLKEKRRTKIDHEEGESGRGSLDAFETVPGSAAGDGFTPVLAGYRDHEAARGVIREDEYAQTPKHKVLLHAAKARKRPCEEAHHISLCKQ